MDRLIAVVVTLALAAGVIGLATFGPPPEIARWFAAAPESPPPQQMQRAASLPPGLPLAEPPLPSFDVVRIDPLGSAVIAGRALPGAEIVISANGREIGRVVANARGDWVFYVDTPLDEGTQELTLVMRTADGGETAGEQRVIVAVPERVGDVPLVVLSDDQGGSRVLQKPQEGDTLEVALEAIDYDAEGNVVFSGRAAPGARILFYVDNGGVGEATADLDGRWRLKPQVRILPGVHALRLDQVDAGGKVVARIELPFEREAPEGLAMSNGKVVVQPGNSLWRISRRLYGTGFRYTLIYEANRSQIRDPDLIYPGQVFTVPAGPGS